MTNGTLKELTPEDMARIAYTAWQDLAQVTGEVADWPAYDSLPEQLKGLETLQIDHITANIKLRPHQLHEYYKVTGQKMIRDLNLDDNIIAKLDAYMIPFSLLSVINQTRFRLQVQLARTLLRHNRNVKRAQKRQR